MDRASEGAPTALFRPTGWGIVVVEPYRQGLRGFFGADFSGEALHPFAHGKDNGEGDRPGDNKGLTPA